MVNLGAEHENLDQKAYLILKNMIIDRKLLPGDKIPEEKLARELGISRRRLLVEAQPRRGYFVRFFTMQEMVSIFELREVLEGLAARRAAHNITDTQINRLKTFFQQFDPSADISDYKAYSREDRSFHNFVVDVATKEFLKSILQTFNIISFSYQMISSEGLVRSPNETIHEHLSVIKAISDRDSDAAENLMRQHFKKTIATLKQDIEDQRQDVRMRA